MVQIFVPHAVEAEAARLGPHQARLLRLVFGDDQNAARACGVARRGGQLGDDIARGVVEDLLGGVEPQPVEMEFAHPIGGVFAHEFPHRSGALAVEIDGIAPFVLVFVGDVGGREKRQVIPVRPEMIVDDVENDAEPEPVRRIDEGAQIVRRPVKPRRREQRDPVIAPAEPARKFRDRHHFDDADADLLQERQLVDRGRPRAFAREGADMHLIDDLAFASDALPGGVRPAIGGGIDDGARLVRPLGLRARGGIGQDALAAIDAIAVARARPRRGDMGAAVAVLFGLHRMLDAVDDEHDRLRQRRPYAEAHAPTGLQFGADRHGPLRGVAAERSFFGEIKGAGQGAIRSG